MNWTLVHIIVGVVAGSFIYSDNAPRQRPGRRRVETPPVLACHEWMTLFWKDELKNVLGARPPRHPPPHVERSTLSSDE